MYTLLKTTYEALSGDAELAGLADISQFRQPENPSALARPAVVFVPRDIGDERGLHGAALNPEIEVSVWHYGPSNYLPCLRVAQRVGEIMISKFAVPGGGTTRWGEILGWQQIDQPDPNTVLLRCEYRCRYWSAERVAALVAAAA